MFKLSRDNEHRCRANLRGSTHVACHSAEDIHGFAASSFLEAALW